MNDPKTKGAKIVGFFKRLNYDAEEAGLTPGEYMIGLLAELVVMAHAGDIDEQEFMSIVARGYREGSDAIVKGDTKRASQTSN